jgi:D-xylose transport system permease protein
MAPDDEIVEGPASQAIAEPGVEEVEDATAAPASDEELLAARPEILAESLGDYARAWMTRIRSGDSGALPILVGLVLVVIYFQLQESAFLTSGNLVNLFVQSAAFILLGAAEIYVLLLSEIDLSIGSVLGVSAWVVAILLAPNVGWTWWLAVIAGLSVAALIGLLQGTLITRLGVPSFVVTLGGLLGWQGVMIEMAAKDSAAVGGVLNIAPTSPIAKLVSSSMSPALGWIVLVVVIGAFAAVSISGAARRRARGLSAPPLSVVILKVAVAAIAGIVLVLICNANRGTLLFPLKGVPWVIPFVLIIIGAWTWLLSKTRLGRYIYAIGANPEAARRAGIGVARVRTIAFMLCSFTAGLAAIAYESRLGSISIGVDVGNLVLYGVAAAVIGGTSLFGGRGKMIHALIGGVVIATVVNGLTLMGVSAGVQFISTAVVLVLAVTVDSLLRRRGRAA